MLKNVILSQKEERDKLLSREYTKREAVDGFVKNLENPLIKVITGPRRAGKSVFALTALRDESFAYLNFEDENLLKVENYDDIVRVIYEVYGGVDYFLFDEIQNLDKWEIFVNKLNRRGYNLIITGSNARLLSSELATSLTGRYIPFEVLPFSFKEYLGLKKFSEEGELQYHLDNYLRIGGYPEVLTTEIDPVSYLGTLFDSVILTDVVKRYNVRFSSQIYDLATYLISNFSCEYSLNKIKNVLGFRSVVTVANYVSYLEEAYLIFSLDRFSFKAGERIKSPKKVYVVDNGIVSAKAFQFSKNTGGMMENLVFVELLRRGYKPNLELFYYKEAGEVDFVLKKGKGVEKLIQVCFDLENEEVYKREIKSLKKAGEELDCRDLEVISWEKEGVEKGITFIPLWKWLTGKGVNFGV